MKSENLKCSDLVIGDVDERVEAVEDVVVLLIDLRRGRQELELHHRVVVHGVQHILQTLRVPTPRKKRIIMVL